jgi:N-acyl-D-aspartate/D-glutamate deacylase
MAYDLVIRNGTIVDGSGKPRFHGDVAIEGSRVAEVGKVNASAKRTIDASDLVVAPGFVDPHTHYDAQVFWDPMFSCSSWHGVTSVVTGNCGFTLAPCKPEDRPYLTHMLAVVEDMPLPALEAGLTWEWDDYSSFIDAIDRRPKAINMGCYIGHSAVRRNVMGEDCRRTATPDEVARIQQVVAAGLKAGALGFSSSRIPVHVDGEGKSVPSAFADMNELTAVARAMRQVNRGVMEFTAKLVLHPKGNDDVGDLPELVSLAKESQRPLTFVSVRYMPRYPERSLHILSETAKVAAANSVRLYPQMGCRRFGMYLNWNKLMPPFAHHPAWRKVMFLRGSERIAALSDPVARAEMRSELAADTAFNGWSYMLVKEAKRPDHKTLEGQSIAAIAASLGKDPLETYLDLCVTEDCAVDFDYLMFDTEDSVLGKMLKDPNVLLETDAGAHLATLCNADFPSYLLSHWVRETSVLSIEEAVARITSHPAEVFGLKDRGNLKPGYAADIVIFDPQRVGTGRSSLVRDLPAQQARLIRESEGIYTVIVNGSPILEGGQPTGETPGQVLRGES